LQREWFNHLLDKYDYKDRCGGLDISIPPKAQVDYWVFKAHAKLPCELKGIKFKMADMVFHALTEQFGLALMEPDSYDHHQGDINPDFDLKKTSEAEQKYIKQLYDTLSDIISRLNDEKGLPVTDSTGRITGRFFANNLGQTDNTYYGTGTLHINTHPRDTEQFKELLNAIEKNDEPKFIQQMIRLSTTFDQKHAQAKSGFIDVMTHLFATKEFPSKGAKTSYLHIILRCGGFSSGRD
jgi:hypothetical protein